MNRSYLRAECAPTGICYCALCDCLRLKLCCLTIIHASYLIDLIENEDDDESPILARDTIVNSENK